MEYSPDSETAHRKDSTNRKGPCQWRVVRRSADEDLIVPWSQVPAILLFVECLQYAVVDRNGNCLRFSGRECDPHPSHQSPIRLVCTQGKPRVHLSDFGPGPFSSVLDGEAHCLRA